MAVRIPLITDFDGRGIRKAIAEFKQLETTSAKASFALRKSFVPATAALAGFGAFMVKAAKGAEEARIAQAALANVLDSMGYPEATNRVSQYAEQLERTLAIDADVIKRTQTKLATFKQLTATVNNAGGAFDRATMAALDLAAAGFGEAETNAVQLGKALQDPIKGIAALSRAGVTFTAQEKQKIKELVESNRLLEAQDLILSAIESQVGGTAKESVSSFESMRLALARISDAFGEIMLPILQALAPVLESVAAWFESNPQFVLALSVAIVALTGSIIAANVGLKAYNAVGLITNGINKLLGTSFTRLQTAMGVIGVALTAAVAVYSLLSGSKTKTTQATKDLTAALKLEKDAQEETIQQLIETDKNTRLAFQALDKLGLTIDDLNDYVQRGTGELKNLENNLGRALQTAGVTKDEFIALGSTVQGLTKNFNNSAQAVDLYNRVSASNSQINIDVTKSFVGLNTSIFDAYNKTKSLGTATNKTAEAAANLRQGFREAQKGVTDALKNMRDTFASTIGAAIRSAVNFGQIRDAAKDAGTTFMAGLSESVAKAKVFADRLQQLLRAGLSQDALAQVAQAGADAGTLIADELLAGGAATIGQANDLVAAAQKAAIDTGTLAGATYYNEGTVLAQQLTQGITDVISKYKIKLSSPGLTEKQLNRLRNRFAIDVDFVMSQVPALAQGGIVSSPTLALIGEAGPEAVVPLDKMGQMGNVTINVNGGDPQAVVDALRRYMQINGSVPIRVS
jgi:hypothetical protein